MVNITGYARPPNVGIKRRIFMKKKQTLTSGFFVLVFTLTLSFSFITFWLGSCSSSPESSSSSQKGDFKKATKLHNTAAEKMNKDGETNAEVLKLYTQAIDEYKKCITVTDKNTGEAYNYLGRILYNGPRSLRNYNESLSYLYEASEIYNKEFEILKEYVQRKNYLDNKANIDFVNVSDRLDLCYNEIGTVQYRLGDFSSSFANYQKAASKPRGKSYSGDVGLMYWLGLGTKQDLIKAMNYYDIAAKSGRDYWTNIYALSYHINEVKKGVYYSESMDLYLAHLHSRSMGEEKNVWMPLLTRSADLGCPPSQIDLWITYRDNNEPAKGKPYLQKALASNFVPAFFHMGFAYHAGIGDLKVDYREAQKWYEKAAVEGHPNAQNNMGALYYSNQIKADRGFSNQEMSYYWWNAAAEQGYSSAKYNLTLVERYQPPLSKLEAALKILNSIQGVVQTSTNVYNSLNKSRIVSYVPPNRNSNQTAQNNTSTSSNSSSNNTRQTASSERETKICPRCHGDGKCPYSSYNGYACSGKGYYDCTLCSGKGIWRNKVCTSCNGEKTVECGICHGSGKCQRCDGTGKI
jgi:TPR repeat protein